MAQAFPLPVNRALDTNGITLSGAKLYFYTTGTTTPQSVYANSALSVAHANPVVADSGGLFAPIFLDPTLTYRVILKTSADVTIQDVDPVSVDSSADFQFDPGLSGDVTRTVQAKLRDVVSVKDFGAVGDGVTDDTTAITSALASGREVYLPAGTYNVTPIVLSGFSSLKIRGSGRDVTKIMLTSTGTALTFSNCQWLQISDLSVEASGTAQTLASAIGVQLDTGSSNASIERINVYGFSLDGIRLVGTSGTHLSGHTVRDVYVLGCGRNQIYGTYSDDFTLDNVQTGKLAGITLADFGILLENCGEGALINIKLWENKRALKLLTCTGIRYTGVRAELSDFENLWIESGNNHNFDASCRFYSASQGGNGVSDNIYLKSAVNVNLPVEATTWDATYARYAVNVDTGCDRIGLTGLRAAGFDTAKGPVRVTSLTTRLRADKVHANAAAVAAGSTNYIGPNGATAGEGPAATQVTAPMQVLGFQVAVIAAPGAALNYTYTFRKNGADTSLTGQISGAASFSLKALTATPLPELVLDENDYWSIKLVTDAGATVTDHRITVLRSEH